MTQQCTLGHCMPYTYNLHTYHKEAGLKKARVERLPSLSCLLQDLAHVNVPKVTRGIEDITYVTEQLVCLNLKYNVRQYYTTSFLPTICLHLTRRHTRLHPKLRFIFSQDLDFIQDFYLGFTRVFNLDFTPNSDQDFPQIFYLALTQVFYLNFTQDFTKDLTWRASSVTYFTARSVG